MDQRRSVLSVLVFLFWLPWRLIAVFLLAILIIPGIVMMWRLPSLAQTHKLDLSLLTLRVIDGSRASIPLAPLGYQSAIRKHLIDLSPDLAMSEILVRDATLRLYSTKASSVQQTKTPEGESRYTVIYRHGATKQVAFTTPHLNVPLEELTRARQSVSRIFQTETQMAEVRQWGESLFWTEWLRRQALYDLPYDLVPDPKGGTPEEQVWLAWTVLSASPAVEEELFRLEEMFHQTFPATADREAALAWARGMYDRMEEDFKGYQRHVQAGPGYKPESRNSREEIVTACQRVLPPKTTWTYYWLLYRYVGLSESSRTAALEHWRNCFPSVRRPQVLAYGNKVLEERRAANEPLPPVADLLPWLCAVERLVGTDPYGGRCRSILDNEYGLKYFTMLYNGVLTANPNDDFFYLEASADPLRLLPEGANGATWRGKCFRLGSSIVFVAILHLGVGVIVAVLARLLLRGHNRDLWQAHLAGRGKRPWWLSLSAVLVVASVASLIVPHTVDESMLLHTGDYTELFAAALAATLVGSVLISACRRTLAVFLVRMGVDVERTWLDEVLGILAGGLILHHFGASVATIALFAMSALIPAVIQKMRTRRRPSPFYRSDTARALPRFT